MAAAAGEEERVDCEICYVDYGPEEMVKLECGHSFCQTCFGTQARTKLKMGELVGCMDLACPKMREGCAPETLEGVLGGEELREYGELYGQVRDAARAAQLEKEHGTILPTEGLVAKFAAFVKEQECLRIASHTDFYHYTCCGEKDGGWGCAYRCLQMIISNLLFDAALNPSIPATFRDAAAGPSPLAALADVPSLPGAGRWALVPSLREIQRRLAEVGALAESDVGSSKWIEPPHCGLFLRSHGLEAFDCCFDTADSLQREPFQARLSAHFAEQRAPVMIDDRVKAYCLLGLKHGDPESPSAVTHVLRFDPHVFVYPSLNSWGTRGVEWMPFDKAFQGAFSWLILFPTRLPAAPDRIPPFITSSSTPVEPLNSSDSLSISDSPSAPLVESIIISDSAVI